MRQFPIIEKTSYAKKNAEIPMTDRITEKALVVPSLLIMEKHDIHSIDRLA
jgi:hypothetical protein